VNGPFRTFSAEHLATLAAGAVILAALILAGRRGGRCHRLATGLLASANLAAYPLNQLAWSCVEHPVSLDNTLPLHLCDLAAILAGFALLGGSRALRDLTYYWGLAATLQALLTPNVAFSFPHPVFLSFFSQHFAIVGAALYLPLADRWRPQLPPWRSPLRVFLLSNAYLLAMLALNRLLGTNFGFVTRPPENPSLIDHLGPWPLYLASLQGIALAAFALLTLPFLRANPFGKRPAHAYLPPP
jgi:hypothetical integral membrane protein (TIGR02206 family)